MAIGEGYEIMKIQVALKVNKTFEFVAVEKFYRKPRFNYTQGD